MVVRFLCRTYHLIATASKDGFVRIHKLSSVANKTPAASIGASDSKAGASSKSSSSASSSSSSSAVTPASGYTCELVAKLGDHKAEVWRVAWNITGTMLASTGDDGTARLWKSDFKGRWHSTLVASAAASSGTTGQSAAGGAGTSSSSTATAAAPQQQQASTNFHFGDAKDDHKM
jgi:nucleoporin SEH1